MQLYFWFWQHLREEDLTFRNDLNFGQFELWVSQMILSLLRNQGPDGWVLEFISLPPENTDQQQ